MVLKSTLLVEVLSEEEIGQLSLADIAYEMARGDFMGTYQVIDVCEVPKARLVAEQLRMGGDGTLFTEDEPLLDDDGDAEAAGASEPEPEPRAQSPEQTWAELCHQQQWSRDTQLHLLESFLVERKLMPMFADAMRKQAAEEDRLSELDEPAPVTASSASDA